MNLIFNESLLDDFIDNKLDELINDEVFYITIFSRAKYLSHQEVEFYFKNTKYRNTIKLNSKAIKSKKSFKQDLIELISNARLKPIKGNYDYTYPIESLVCFISVNKKSMRKALMRFEAEINLKFYNLTSSVISNNNNAISENYKQIKNLDYSLDNFIGSKKSNSNDSPNIDIDFDVKHTSDNRLGLRIYKEFKRNLKDANVKFYAINTAGGYHVVINSNGLKSNNKINFANWVKKFKKYTRENEKEIVINTIQMIPIPGVYQGGFKVTFDEEV